MKYLTDERRIKAVTVCFTDLEGRPVSFMLMGFEAPRQPATFR